MNRAALPLFVIILTLPFVLCAADSTSRPDGEASYEQQMADYRSSYLSELHEKLGIRGDQAALWKQVEQRLARLYMSSIQLMARAKSQTPKRKLDELELINESQKAEVHNRSLLLDAFRWLYPQLDAQQRSRIDVMEEDTGDGLQHVLANAETRELLARGLPDWLDRRDTLKQALQLRPEQRIAWQEFETETNSTMPRTRAVLLDSAQPKQPLLPNMTTSVRLQESLSGDMGDILTSLRRLDRILDADQRSTLDTFLAQPTSIRSKEASKKRD